MTSVLTVRDVEVFEALTDEQKRAAALLLLSLFGDVFEENEFGGWDGDMGDFLYQLRGAGFPV